MGGEFRQFFTIYLDSRRVANRIAEIVSDEIKKSDGFFLVDGKVNYEENELFLMNLFGSYVANYVTKPMGRYTIEGVESPIERPFVGQKINFAKLLKDHAEELAELLVISVDEDEEDTYDIGEDD